MELNQKFKRRFIRRYPADRHGGHVGQAEEDTDHQLYTQGSKEEHFLLSPLFCSSFLLRFFPQYILPLPQSAASVSNALGSVVVSYSIFHALLSLAGVCHTVWG